MAWRIAQYQRAENQSSRRESGGEKYQQYQRSVAYHAVAVSISSSGGAAENIAA